MGLAGEASAIYDYLSAATTTTTTINIAAVAVAINNHKNVKDSCEEKDTKAKATATIKCNQRVALIAQFDFDLGLTH